MKCRGYTAALMVMAAAWGHAALPVRGADVTLAERGRPAAYTIVVKRDASPCLRFAAEELSGFLERQTGVRLPVAEEGDELPTAAVVLGDSVRFNGHAGRVTLPEDAFRIRVEGARLFISGGNDRGVLYGVYELLERFGGCAWYSAEFETVPELKAFSVPDDFDETQAPAFALRSQSANGLNSHHLLAVRNKMNLEGFDEKLGGSSFRFDPVLGKCHTFENLLPVAKWFDSHPEYFSERNGRRVRHRPQLCLSNPEVLRICTEKTLERIVESYPKGIRRFGISQNDWGNWCECAECAAVDKREKSHSGTLIAFVNRIAEVVEKKYPDVLIETLAYSYTRRPPATLVPRKNVQICLCTIECDFAKPISLGRSIENRSARHSLAQWAKYPSKLSVWDYAGDFACYQHVWPNFRSLHENLRLFRSSGVDELFELGTGGGRNDIWADLRTWFIAKWMWNPDLEEEPLLRKCLADCFGPAADEIRRYYELVHSAPRDTKRHPMRCFESVYAPGISDAMLEKAAATLASAREKSKGSKFADNVHKASMPVDFMRAMRGYARPSMASAPVDASLYESQREGARRVVEAMDSPASLRFADDPVWGALFAKRLREFVAAAEARQPTKRLAFEEWTLTGTTPVSFRVVEDPLARDGKAVLLPGDLPHCSCWFELDSVITDASGLYMPRVRVRVGQSGPRTAAFFAGIYNLDLRKTVIGESCYPPDIPAGKAKDGEAYFWYNIGAVSPKRGDVLWITLGRSFGDPHPDVWIDRVELVRLH